MVAKEWSFGGSLESCMEVLVRFLEAMTFLWVVPFPFPTPYCLEWKTLNFVFAKTFFFCKKGSGHVLFTVQVPAAIFSCCRDCGNRQALVTKPLKGAGVVTTWSSQAYPQTG